MAPAARSSKPQQVQYVAKPGQGQGQGQQANGLNGVPTNENGYIHHPIRSVTSYAYATADSLIHTDKYPIIKQSYNTFLEPVVKKVYKPHLEAHVNSTYEKQVSPLIDTIDVQLSSILRELQKNQWLQRVERTLIDHRNDLSPHALRLHAIEFYTTALHYIEQHQPLDVASFIQGVRSKLAETEGAVETGKKRVLSVWHSSLEVPLIELYQAAKTGWAAKDLSIVSKKVKEERTKLYSNVSSVLTSQYQNILSTYLNVFDYVVPPVQATNPNLNPVMQQKPRPSTLTLGNVTGHITGRIHDRVLYRVNTVKTYGTRKAQETYGTVKTFSAKHVQPVAGIDPVLLAENVYTARTQQAVAKLGEVKTQLDELQVAVQQYVAAQSKRVQESNIVTSAHNAVDQARVLARSQVDNARNLAAVSVNKAKSTLPQNIQVQVEKLSQTLTDLNLRNLTDIQNSLGQIRDLLASAPQEIQGNSNQSSVKSNSLQAHQKKSSIASPQPPEKAFPTKPSMWTSPVKPEDMKQK